MERWEMIFAQTHPHAGKFLEVHAYLGLPWGVGTCWEGPDEEMSYGLVFDSEEEARAFRGLFGKDEIDGTIVREG